MIKPHAYGLLLLLFLLPATVHAQFPDGMTKRAQRLVHYFDKYHLEPREHDETFGNDIHEQLLALLDEDKMLFEASDVMELQSTSDSLADDLIREKLRYANRFMEIYDKRVAESETFIRELVKTMPDIYGSSAEFRTHDTYATNTSERKKRWKNQVLYLLQQEILASLDFKSYPQDATLEQAKEKAWESTKTVLEDYLKSLKRLDKQFELYYLNAVTLAYDPHSSYFNDEMHEDFSEELSSTQFVFGITYGTTLDGQLEITEILPGSSAWFSEEIQEEDRIVSITSSTGQHIDAREATTAEMSEFFSALSSDSITIVLRHGTEEKKAELVRSRVYSDNDIIKTALLDGEKKIGYISLPDFYTSWTDTSMFGCANDVAKSILKLKKANVDGLILDLRDNGGGSLWEAVNLVGIFIDFGPVLLIEEANGEVASMKDFNRGSMYSGPLMILVNSESASASELVAGTLQDYQRALIVGQTSFGKATGQSITSLDPKVEFLSGWIEEDPNWGYARTTDIGLYRLNKSSAQKKGVQPDIEVRPFVLNETTREEELQHAITLDSVEKKIYFSTVGKIPVQALDSWYHSLEQPQLDSIQAILEKIELLTDQLNHSLDLKKSIENYMEIERLNTRFEELRDNLGFAYQARSFQFDPDLLRISPYLERYNTRFLENLGKDLELNESYKIMSHFIELRQ